jgi:cellulose synthase/poly-beta-1,6-N-acetylglucosamine synthase-like glycosyltransferase
MAGKYRPISSHLAIAPPVSVVIPAMNEAENLPYVFKTLPAWIHEVVLVDGNSTDDTVEVARELWPDVKVVTQQGKGKGDALITGFEACTGDIIVTARPTATRSCRMCPRWCPGRTSPRARGSPTAAAPPT